jgi:mRNA interferase YafQ
MRTISHTNQFKKDYKREIKGKSSTFGEALDAELFAVVWVLIFDGTLAPRYRDHQLDNDWKDHRDCHIRPDLVLIYRKPDDDSLELVRLGSHS